MRQLRQRRPSRPAPVAVLATAKLQTIDFAVEQLGVETVADLGGVWAVDAGYTFHALSHSSVRRAHLVDTGITASVRERAAAEPRLHLIEADFSSPTVAESVGAVDLVMLFDVLLHQVHPDWDQVLETWAEHAGAFAIVNPQLRAGAKPVRLMDLSPEQYAEHTPANHISVPWDALDQVNPRYGKATRDVHEYWQWGIPNKALHDVMTGLGYHARLYANYGQWRDVATFDNVAFVYARSTH